MPVTPISINFRISDSSFTVHTLTAAYSGEIAHQFRKHAAQFSEKILVEIIVH